MNLIHFYLMVSTFVTFIVTSGDRFEAAEEINDLFENKSPVGQLYVTLKEAGFQPERDWPLREQGVSYVVDLAVPLGGDQWLPIALTAHESTPVPPGALCFTAESDLAECVRRVRQATQPKI